MDFSNDKPIIRRATSLVLLVVTALVLLGISAPEVRAAPPTLTILSPMDNAVVGNGTPVSIVFVTSDFNLTEPGSGGPGPNEGHVNVFVDGVLHQVTAETTVVMDLQSGTHTVRLQLVADNGTALNPDVSDSVTVVMTHGPAGGTPGIAITYPAEGAPRGPDTAVSFQLTNFALVPPGAPVAPNEGHIEVLLDGRLYQELTVYKPVAFSDLPDGDRTVTLRLVDSAHNPLTPDRSTSVTFRVIASDVIDITPGLAVVNLLLAGVVIVALYYPIRKGKR
jgi:hypothetical protein